MQYNNMINTFECRICYEEEKKSKKLIRPCACDGTGRYVHRKCLEDWIEYSIDDDNSKRCQDCNQKYIFILQFPKETYFIKILIDTNNIIYQYSLIFIFSTAASFLIYIMDQANNYKYMKKINNNVYAKSDKIYNNSLTLPIYNSMTDDEIKFILNICKNV